MQPDYFIERKKLRTRLTLYKIALVILLAILLTIGHQIMRKQIDLSSISLFHPSSYIGSVYIKGIITEDREREKILEAIAENKSIKALIVNIQSPGGTLGGSEQLYRVLRKISVAKPVVAVMQDAAASGGYMTAIAADYIVASPATVTGSIGVVWQSFELTELANKMGINLHAFKSTPLKASPSYFEKVTPEAEEATMTIIKDTYDYFVELVSERRGLPKDQVIKLADGRIYTGRQAQQLKLVDIIGSKDEALKWLHDVKKIDSKLKVIDLELSPNSLLTKMIGTKIQYMMANLAYGLKGPFALAF